VLSLIKKKGYIITVTIFYVMIYHLNALSDAL